MCQKRLIYIWKETHKRDLCDLLLWGSRSDTQECVVHSRVPLRYDEYVSKETYIYIWKETHKGDLYNLLL